MDSRRTYPPGTKPHGNAIQIRFKEIKGGPYTYKTLDLTPSPANLEKAGKLRKQIVDAIKHQVFNYADFFPDDPRVTVLTSSTFDYFAQSWLDNPDNDWRPQTRRKYKNILNRYFMPNFHGKPIRTIDYPQLIQCLTWCADLYKKQHHKPHSKSLYNDWINCLRGVFGLAIVCSAITNNPALNLSRKTRDKPTPDPFSMDEADAIIASIYQHDGEFWGAFFELGFYSGLRYPSEPTALTWPKIDLRREEMRIDQIRTQFGIQPCTKTGYDRMVDLNVRALHALKTMKGITGFQDSWVFSKGGNPIISADEYRAIFRAALKRLHIRQRDPYTMRHSYATFGLMNDNKPAYMAEQLGHSLKEFFDTYAKWINEKGNQAEKAKMNATLNPSGAKRGQESDKNW